MTCGWILKFKLNKVLFIQPRRPGQSGPSPQSVLCQSWGNLLYFMFEHLGGKLGILNLGLWNGFRCVMSHTMILHRWTILLAHFLGNVFASNSWTKPNTNSFQTASHTTANVKTLDLQSLPFTAVGAKGIPFPVLVEYAFDFGMNCLCW